MKGYATEASRHWLYPPKHMPPMGVKLHILTRGGVAIHDHWRWDGGFLAWEPLPKRDWAEEARALEYIENGERK